MSKIKLALDAGHGQNTYPETRSKGVPEMAEHDFNATVVKYAKELAELNGFEVLLTQPLFGRDVPLRQRTDLANKEKVDFLISFHADANSNKDANGHWIFYWHTSSKGKKFAQIWDKYANQIMRNNCRGTQESKSNHWTNFHMVRETNMPAVLIEHDFMTSPKGIKLLLSDDFRRKCAKTAIRAACEYFGIPFKFKKESTPNPYNQLVKENMFNTDIFFYKFKQSDIELKYVKENGLTVSQIRKKYNADLAINANYITGTQNIGNSKIGDKVLSHAYGKTLKWNSFGYRDGKIHIGQLDFNDKWDFLFQFTPLIVDNGVSSYKNSIISDQTANDIAGKDVTPQRTFGIIDKFGDVYFVVSDGRPPSNSTGLTIDNMEKFALSKNAQVCFNFDGGSSTSMSDRNGSIGQNSGTRVRPVHHALLVFIKKPKVVKQDSNKVEVAIKINGDVVGKGLIINDLTHLPIRSISELLGSTVRWDSVTNRTYLNGILIPQSDLILIDNLNHIPLRKFAELLGVKVDWDGVNREVLITK